MTQPTLGPNNAHLPWTKGYSKRSAKLNSWLSTSGTFDSSLTMLRQTKTSRAKPKFQTPECTNHSVVHMVSRQARCNRNLFTPGQVICDQS